MSQMLKRERTAAEQADEHAQYLTFHLGQEMFAVGILQVREIIEYGNVTTVPMMPMFIRGVINLRGSVVPVIDLAARFGRGVSQVQRRSCIVIMEVDTGEEERRQLGVMVDAVSEVVEIPASDIEPPPSFGAKIRTEFIAGMGKVAGRFVILLNIGKVLAVEDMALLVQLGQSQEDPESAATKQMALEAPALPAGSEVV